MIKLIYLTDFCMAVRVGKKLDYLAIKTFLLAKCFNFIIAELIEAFQNFRRRMCKNIRFRILKV